MLICMFIILFGGSTTKGLYACCVALKKHTFSRDVCLHCWMAHCLIFYYCVVLLPTTPENVTLDALTVSYSGVNFPKLHLHHLFLCWWGCPDNDTKVNVSFFWTHVYMIPVYGLYHVICIWSLRTRYIDILAYEWSIPAQLTVFW